MNLAERKDFIENAALANNEYAKLINKNVTFKANAGGEIPKYYAFDEKGHVLFASTSQSEASEDVKELFMKVVCFFAGMTAALAQAKKNLFDYEAVNAVISGSGMFVALGKELRTFSSESTSASLNTTIIQNVLGSNITGGGMKIAQNVLASLGGQITASYEKSDTKKEISHVLFICETIMGIPMVSVSLYHTNLEQHSWVVNTNCAAASRSSINFKYESDDFMFADPAFIKKFTPEFERSKEYDEFIERLVKSIPA
ncbi:hypothetical protein RQ094_003872 [Salmonella enterica]|nr:hypothetical protein [Salmonella enterica]EDC7605743.1 hypothetical protein [Salmonella enterica subsp. enterica serovar Newport]EBK0028779.1 hypothetical protein [Salmonella enterica]ECX3818725.1 hypothetical protein [Salmonella enterica]ECY2497778.1 hypothetical protein [Salmonella enterica]